MSLNKEQLCRLIPHAGTMCLLDRVEHWDDTTIVCTSRTHRDLDNPLRTRDQLHAVCGVEYAAQAMAVHGGLSAATGSAPGYLAGLRDVRLEAQRLDNIEEQLEVRATRIMADAGSLIYRFTVSAGTTELLSGRATVFLGRVQE